MGNSVNFLVLAHDHWQRSGKVSQDWRILSIFSQFYEFFWRHIQIEHRNDSTSQLASELCDRPEHRHDKIWPMLQSEPPVLDRLVQEIRVHVEQLFVSGTRNCPWTFTGYLARHRQNVQATLDKEQGSRTADPNNWGKHEIQFESSLLRFGLQIFHSPSVWAAWWDGSVLHTFDGQFV